jgi:hypothetical protein
MSLRLPNCFRAAPCSGLPCGLPVAAFILLTVLCEAAATGAQAQIPHVRIEPHLVVPFTEIADDPTSTTVYGARIAGTVDPAVLLYGGYTVGVTNEATRERSPRRQLDDTVSHLSTGVRFVTSLNRRYGLFATASLGLSVIDNGAGTERGANVGFHVEYWLHPRVLVRSGIDLALANDGIYGAEIGIAYVPIRF